MVPEAKFQRTDAGLVPQTPGWFVMNAREARWFSRAGELFSLPLTGHDEYEAETFFGMLGMAIRVISPGAPSTTYHWETEQEDFLVLSGEAVLIVEGVERPVRQWDFIHCPPETSHAFAGAGSEPCVLLCASSRQFQKDGPWGFYVADETAARYNASPAETTQDGALAYERFAASVPVPYHSGLLPGDPVGARPPRTRAERRRDTLALLSSEVDAWVASASSEGVAHLIPLSYVWDGTELILSTPRESVTGRNLLRAGEARISLGATRDVVLITGTIAVGVSDDVADRHAAATGFDPRTLSTEYVYLRLRPQTIQAWREENELSGRTIMRGGEWLG